MTQTAVAGDLERNPDDPALLLARGQALLQTGDKEAALADFSAAIESGADIAELFYYRGYIYRQRGDYAEAIRDLDQAIALAPDMGLAYYERALAYYYSGEQGRVVDDMSAAIALLEGDAQTEALALAYHHRGTANFALEDHEAALEDFRRAAALFFEVGRVDDAIADWQVVLAVEPDDASAQAGLGVALFSSGLAHYEQALEVEPGYGEGGWIERNEQWGRSLLAEAQRVLAELNTEKR